MEYLKEILVSNMEIVMVVLSIIIFLQFIFIIITLVKTNKIENRYRKLMRSVNSKNLEALVIDYFDKVEEVENSMNEVSERFDEYDERLDRCVQKTAIKRYQAFNDVGSDLSYSIALLDCENDGVIITSIYGRDQSTSYAKPIDKGISRYTLSEEEEEVLNKAISDYESKAKIKK